MKLNTDHIGVLASSISLIDIRMARITYRLAVMPMSTNYLEWDPGKTWVIRGRSHMT